MHDIHLIGNAHIDPAWLWRYTEGYSEVRSTFRAALDRLNEYPDFVFTCAGACYYKWIEESCPAMFEEIRQRVKEGRWVIVNGWWLQPDCNIPSGESFARHSLYSQRYFKEKFGITCKTGYNVDSFGHNAMLPQILKKSGMTGYVFMRPGDHEKANVPQLFQWESPDGTRIPTFKIRTPAGYGVSTRENFDKMYLDAIEHNQAENSDCMLFYGVGNHGGGPTIALLDHIEARKAKGEIRETKYSSPDAYFAAQQGKDLPVLRDELQIHAIGCYTAYIAVKQQNRRTEAALTSAEKTSAAAKMLTGMTMATKKLGEAWTKLLFNQFHDIMCGCCIREAYDDAFATFGYAQHTAEEARNFALQQISWQIDTLGDDKLPRSKEEDWRLWGLEKRGTPLVAFNPLSYAVKIPLTAPGEMGDVTDGEGNIIETQRVRSSVTNGEDDKYATMFMAELPPMGYKLFYVHKGEKAAAAAYPETDTPVLENEKVRVTLDKKTGMPSSIISKASGREALKAPMRMMLVDETHSDTWGHGLFEYRDEVGEFALEGVRVIEEGPIRQKLRAVLRYGDSRIEADYMLYAGEEYLDMEMLVDWHEKHRMLKLECPVNTTSKEYDAEIPFGEFRRNADGKEKPNQRYIHVHDEKGGLLLVNDSSYGADVKDGVIRQSILRGAIFADHYGKRDMLCRYMEQGEHFFKYRIVPHDGNVNCAYHAEILNNRFETVFESYHKGPLGNEASALQITNPAVNCSALKGAEDGDGYILRLYETKGERSATEIALPLIGREWNAEFGPYEVKTFHVPYDGKLPVTEKLLTEM